MTTFCNSFQRCRINPTEINGTIIPWCQSVVEGSVQNRLSISKTGRALLSNPKLYGTNPYNPITTTNATTTSSQSPRESHCGWITSFATSFSF
ncbi:MAG: hypothetical protein NTZ01_04675 [Verrucomicrobia bacterium]|nr:hypothetical protein [Verrucomicrobiota bacterium]